MYYKKRTLEVSIICSSFSFDIVHVYCETCTPSLVENFQAHPPRRHIGESIHLGKYSNDFEKLRPYALFTKAIRLQKIPSSSLSISSNNSEFLSL